MRDLTNTVLEADLAGGFATCREYPFPRLEAFVTPSELFLPVTGRIPQFPGFLPANM
jgi:hypothetical protein